MTLPKELTTVTPLSKSIALILFILLPILGFFIGMKYQELLSLQDIQTNLTQSINKNISSDQKTSCLNNTKVCTSSQDCTCSSSVRGNDSCWYQLPVGPGVGIPGTSERPGKCWYGPLPMIGGVSSQPNSYSNSGIEGKIFIGPLTPRCLKIPCVNSAPYQATVMVKTSDGLTEVASFTSGKDGTFKFSISPGTYLIVPQQGNPVPVAQSQKVIVSEGKYIEVVINYDSGLR